jgi:hypothetical protein
VVGEVADDDLSTQCGKRLGTLVESPDQRTDRQPPVQQRRGGVPAVPP